VFEETFLLKMGDYPANEIVDMIRIVGEAGNNYSVAARLYSVRFPDRRHPNRTTMKRLSDRAEHRGTLKRTRTKTGPNEATAVATIASVMLNPQISTRVIERQYDIPRSTANRILRTFKFHPYHINLTQQLGGEDFQRRVRFCNWARGQIQRNPAFVENLLFTDEATFNNRGQVNRHNCHYYSDVNPHWQRNQEFQRQWSINVWVGIVGDHIIGPYFFLDNLNAANYLSFLQNDLPDLLRPVGNQVLRIMWFQQDGAPAHKARIVKTYLNRRFTNRWIGIGSEIHEFPPRSPDLTPLDFFLWGYVKDIVYAKKPTTREDMKNRIREACRSITPVVLHDVRRAFHRRLERCIQQNGRAFEHLIA